MTVTSSTKGPSGWWYVLAAGIAAVSIVALAVIVGGFLVQFFDLFDMTYFQGPGTHEVYLKEPRKYVVYMEDRAHVSTACDTAPAQEEPRLSIRVADTNAPLPMEVSPEKVTINDREMLGLRSFVAPSRGSYRIESILPENAVPPSVLLAVGPAMDLHQMLWWILLGPTVGGLVGLLGMGSAITIFLVTLVRRLRAGRTQPGAPAPLAPPPR